MNQEKPSSPVIGPKQTEIYEHLHSARLRQAIFFSRKNRFWTVFVSIFYFYFFFSSDYLFFGDLVHCFYYMCLIHVEKLWNKQGLSQFVDDICYSSNLNWITIFHSLQFDLEWWWRCNYACFVFVWFFW